ncbi:hypothetical protein GZ22_04820 [Terribacillus saccharophilus]|uniref:Uncharacterized protein n=1 Tax=Terribacillus saccharophilus TaxID=361277 RepID=A0A075LH65_9BACI|nr:hypothetical protein GZ22_04820 [Terribacillus goriensis]
MRDKTCTLFRLSQNWAELMAILYVENRLITLEQMAILFGKVKLLLIRNQYLRSFINMLPTKNRHQHMLIAVFHIQ